MPSVHFSSKEGSYIGWGAVLAGIGAGVGGFFLGGPAGAAALGTAAYQAVNSASAEKKAQQQLQDAATKQAAIYQPYNQLGLQAGNSLAGALGLAGVTLPSDAAALAPHDARTADGHPLVSGHAVPRVMPTEDEGQTLNAILHRGRQSQVPPGVLLNTQPARGATTRQTSY